jgi:hypothetical protein
MLDEAGQVEYEHGPPGDNVKVTVSSTILDGAIRRCNLRQNQLKARGRKTLTGANIVEQYLGSTGEVIGYDRTTLTVKLKMARDGRDLMIPTEAVGVSGDKWLEKRPEDDVRKAAAPAQGTAAGAAPAKPPGTAGAMHLTPGHAMMNPLIQQHYFPGMHPAMQQQQQQMMMMQQQQQQQMMMQQQMMGGWPGQQMMGGYPQPHMMGGGYPQQQMMGGWAGHPQQQQQQQAPGAGAGTTAAAAAGTAAAATAGTAPAAVTTASSGALPAGWSVAKDPASGKEYYYHATTKQTTWVKPTAEPAASAEAPAAAPAAAPATTSGALPAGWTAATDPASGKQYYYHATTKQTTWEKPT